MADTWIVHPNRLEPSDDEPGRNGHYRSVQRAPITDSTCLARVTLPQRLSRLADDGTGTITFAGLDWYFVVGAARIFARERLGGQVPPPFGFRRQGVWWWWDNTTTTESILETPEALDYVREYLEKVFPRMPIELVDRR
ncbi:MAG: hypothetical protein JST91_20025 [Actinobacteria bacterium]|nr:hypothetical protein [Actinomycetota bacterium]